MPRGIANNPKTSNCNSCGNAFLQNHHTHKYCSRKCKRVVYKQRYGCENTERQYELISGNFPKYFNRLVKIKKDRHCLTVDFLLELLNRQDGKCALSGVKLTCLLEKGKPCKTNVSIDRIDPRGGYKPGNVQLVCAVLNKFRIDTPLDEFVWWCEKVAENAIQKPSGQELQKGMGSTAGT